MSQHVLEPAAREFAGATSQPPFLHELGPDGPRNALKDVRSAPIGDYPVTDAAQDSDSYLEFADGPFLTAKRMAWFWDCYLPDLEKRAEITASPLRATVEEPSGLPEAFVIVDENDVLRAEGEAYAPKLTVAGVRTTSARYNGTIHDFTMLNPLRGTAAATPAVEQAIHVLRTAFGGHDV